MAGVSRFAGGGRANSAAYRLVRRLHGLSRPVRIAVLSLAPACIFPPSLSTDTTDAPANAPPAILAMHTQTQDLVEAGSISEVVGVSDTMTVALVDPDAADILYVRMYVNYTTAKPVPPNVQCQAAPNGTAYRQATCDLTTLCLAPTTMTPSDDMEIVVFDREPLDSGSPAFMAIPPDGFSASKYLHLTCTTP
jgi:hypothetical protein